MSKKRSSTGEGDAGLLDVIVESPVEKKLRKEGFDFGVSTSATVSTSSLMDGTQVINPPFSIDEWTLAPEISTRLGSSIFIRSQNVAGLGWELVPKQKYVRKMAKSRKEMTPEEVKEIDGLVKLMEQEKDRVDDFLESPNPKKSLVNILRNVIADRECVGNGYMTVQVALTDSLSTGIKAGYPIRLDKLIGHKVRITKNGMYAVQQDSRTVYFKDWEDNRVINSDTGREHVGGMLSPEKHALKIIHFKVDGFRDTPYGVPRHLSAGPAIAGSRFAAERNASFFENDATPRIAIIVSGPARLSKESRDDIRQFVERKGKGPDNAGRVMILQAGKREGMLNDKEDVKISIEKLTVGVSEDGSFLKYQEKGSKDIAEAFNLHPVFFDNDASRASANTGRSITLEQVFEPDINDIEYVLNNTIMKAFGIKYIWLRLKRPKTLDAEGQAAVLSRLQRSGGITPNDIRDFLNLPRFREAWGDYPLPLALQQLKVPEGRAEGSSLVSGLLNLNKMIEKSLESRKSELTNDIEL